MLNKQSIAAVSQLRDISDSIVFTYPITGIQSFAGTMFAFLDVKKLGSEEFEEFGIMKFKELVDLINIAGSDATVELKDKVINISSDKISCRYITSDVDTLEQTFKAKTTMIKKTEEAAAALQFSISSAELSQIKKAANLLKVNDLIIADKGNDIFIRTENSAQRSSNGFSVKVQNPNISMSDSNIMLSITNFLKLPDGDYDVKVCSNGNTFITRFDSTTIDGLIINIASKAC